MTDFQKVQARVVVGIANQINGFMAGHVNDFTSAMWYAGLLVMTFSTRNEQQLRNLLITQVPATLVSQWMDVRH